MDRNKLMGREAEARCAAYLRDRGWHIAAMNYACRGGEIDIVAERGGIIAFVEVKERSGSRFSLPREAVTPAKQRRIRTAALWYLAAHETALQPRFDVAGVTPSPGGPQINIIENAFE